MISIYTSGFNLLKNKFDYQFAIKQFCLFATEVVVCVNTSKDDTAKTLLDLKSIYNNLNIIESNFDYTDPLLDGKIKNSALQHTTMPIKLGLDMDEYVPLIQKDLWQYLAQQLLTDTCSAYMIPSINLYKDWNHYFSITPKWYLHKSGLYRGPVNFARKPDGTVDTTKSDTCELIDQEGNLVPSRLFYSDIESLRQTNMPFVVHTGYVNLEARLIRNKNFWSQHWLTESGGIAPAHKIHETLEDFDEQPKEHKLQI